ncbi:MAG: hypothetical protein HDT30_05505 [Clostridiales bacterium]|nr:hypothetical protein [Clostridiales bacterium]
MDNSDLEVAKMLNEHKTRAYGSLEEGVYIKEKLYEFERVSLFENKFSIMLPKDFVDMPEDLKRIKYISEQRPQIIKMISTGGVDLGFSLLPVKISDNQLMDNLIIMKNVLKKVNPAINVFEHKVIEKNDKTIVWMDFSNPGIDDTVYNIMSLMSVGIQTMHGVFNCRFQEKEQWKDVMIEILCSIKFTDKGGK